MALPKHGPSRGKPFTFRDIYAIAADQLAKRRQRVQVPVMELFL